MHNHHRIFRAEIFQHLLSQIFWIWNFQLKATNWISTRNFLSKKIFRWNFSRWKLSRWNPKFQAKICSQKTSVAKEFKIWSHHYRSPDPCKSGPLLVHRVLDFILEIWVLIIWDSNESHPLSLVIHQWPTSDSPANQPQFGEIDQKSVLKKICLFFSKRLWKAICTQGAGNHTQSVFCYLTV